MKLDDIDLEPAAEKIAERIKRAIQNAPGEKWNRTGKLLQSIRAVSSSDGSAGVAVASDRLERPELMQQFMDEIVPVDLDKATQTAIADATHDAIEVDEEK